ncbi:MAG: hypothetical protein KAJ62_13980 [Desulfobacteraceae bacterium]|nr:hypothetical protein [Desulfobacteraceae bacterium]
MTRKDNKTDKGKDLPALVFRNLYAVLGHLQEAGFRVSRPKIYKDKKKGQIRVNSDGTVLESEVRAYAATLKRKDGSIADLNDVHARKANKEVERLEEQIAKLRFENEKETGKYILRTDFEAELAARAVVLESGFRHLFNMKAREWITLVNGKIEKSADFLQELNSSIDEQLNSYATTKTFQVMFEDDI